MSGEKIEEETYSLIFKCLKHPIRRKILRILVDKQLAFSEILNILSIDSGHLSYHIENLGELVKHSNGKYELSSIGIAATNLMSGVEERPQLLTPNGKLGGKIGEKMISKKVLLVTVCLVVLTIAAGAYGYASQEVRLKELERENNLLEYKIAILRARPLDGYTVIHIGDGNNISAQVVDLMGDYRAQLILLSDVPPPMELNTSYFVIFDAEWITERTNDTALHNFLRNASPTEANLVAIGENTSKFFEALDQAGVYDLLATETGQIRNPAYYNPPMVGYKWRKEIDPDGIEYFYDSILFSNTHDIEGLVEALTNWSQE